MFRFKLLFFFAFLFIGFFYIKNLSTDVYGAGDIGDLISASYVMGVPHPPGYPLFTMLGFLFSHVLPFGTVAFRVGLISVASSILTLIFFYILVIRLTKNKIASLISTFVLAFSYLFWKYTELAEVFAMHNLFVVLLLYLSVRFYQKKEDHALKLLFFVLGLSLTHHHTVIFIFPPLFLLVASHRKKIFKNKKNLVFLFLFFVLGLLPYLYLPFAASKNPDINWGNPVSLNNFFSVILRVPYGTFTANSSPSISFFSRLYFMKYYLVKLFSSVSLPVSLLSLFGFFYSFKIYKKISLLLLLAFFLTGPFFVFYAGFVLTNSYLLAIVERFYIASSIILVIFFGYGLLGIYQIARFKFSKPVFAYIILFACFIFPAALFYYNFQRTDFSKTKIGENLGHDILDSLPNNSALVLSGDIAVFDAWYDYYVLKKRNDIELINPRQDGLAAGNDFVLKREEVLFIKNHNNLPKKNTTATLIYELSKRKSVYSMVPFEIDVKDIEWVPFGLSNRLMNQREIPSKDDYGKEIDVITKSFHIPIRYATQKGFEDITASSTLRLYSSAFSNIGDFFYFYYKSPQQAISYYKKAISMDNRNSDGYAGIGIVEFEAYKNCEESIKNLEKAIYFDPGVLENYLYLYKTYKYCNADNLKQKKLRDQYKEVFKRNLELEE